jgi:dihydroneopterin aldolase
MAQDWVYIRGLEVQTRIGAFAWEREILQTLRFDVDMQTDIRPAAASDDLADALDYKRVSKRIIALVGDCEYELVESIMELVARTLITEFNVPRLKLRVDKSGALRGADGVGLMIERVAADYA